MNKKFFCITAVLLSVALQGCGVDLAALYFAPKKAAAPNASFGGTAVVKNKDVVQLSRKIQEMSDTHARTVQNVRVQYGPAAARDVENIFKNMQTEVFAAMNSSRNEIEFDTKYILISTRYKRQYDGTILKYQEEYK